MTRLLGNLSEGLVALAVVLGFAGAARGDVWTTYGPDGGFVLALAVDPSDSNRVYAAGSGVFKSADAGATWHISNVGLTHLQVQTLAIDPVNSGTVYAGAFGGLFKSTDAGDTWSALPVSALALPDVVAIAVVSTKPSTLYAAIFQGGFSKSTDGGAHWTALNAGLPTLTVQAMAVSPPDASTIYLGTALGGAFKSTDGGLNWQAINSGLPGTNVFGLAVDPSNSDTVYAATNAGVFKTVDGGASWNPFGFPGFPLSFDPIHPGTIYAATGDGVYKSTNGGASWTIANTGMGFTEVFAIAIDPSNTDTVYASTRGDLSGIPVSGVFKSTDAGATWTPSNTGLVAAGVFSVAVDPTTPGTLYAGTGAEGVFKSVDNGMTWAAMNSGLTNFEVLALAVDPNAPATVYAGTGEQGIFRTTDAGGSWVQVLAGGYVDVLVIDPSNSATIYAAGFSAVVKSTDGGATWQGIFSPAETTLTALAIDGSHPATVYAGGIDVGVYKSMDAGQTWVPINTGLTDLNPMAIAVDPTNSDIVYTASFAHGVFKSTDGGASWMPSNSGLGVALMTSLAIDPNNPSTIYVAGGDSLVAPEGGVFHSTDGGGTWHAMSFGLDGTAPRALAVDPADSSRVYAGGRGLFVLQPGSPCGSSAQLACKRPTEPLKASVLVVHGTGSAGNRLLWKWNLGEATARSEFGDPRLSTEYVLCLFDENSGVSTLDLSARAPEGGECGAHACWTQTSAGFADRNGGGTPNGLLDITLSASEVSGQPRIVVRGRGKNLQVPMLPLSINPKVTVQLKNSAGSCWGADYMQAIRNDSRRFEAKSD